MKRLRTFYNTLRDTRHHVAAVALFAPGQTTGQTLMILDALYAARRLPVVGSGLASCTDAEQAAATLQCPRLLKLAKEACEQVRAAIRSYNGPLQ